MPKINKSDTPHMYRHLVLMTLLVALGLPGPAQDITTPERTLVEVRTRLGTMVVALHNETPMLRDRFISRVLDHSIDSTLLHRVVPGFAIEGGAPASKNAPAGIPLGLDPDTIGFPTPVEHGRIHRLGVLSASPAGDTTTLTGRVHRDRFFIVLGVPYSARELEALHAHPGPDTARITYTEDDRRIYATVGGTPHLDGRCTVFGEVVHGLEVLDAIARTPCNTWDRPIEDIPIFTRILP